MTKKSDHYDSVVQDEKDASIREMARQVRHPMRSDAGLRADPHSTPQPTNYVQPLTWWQRFNRWLGW
jgi:hypothetical protein